MGEGSSVRATRKRAHLAQTVEITRMFSILARGGTLPRAFSNPSRRDSNSEFSIYPLLHVSANATRLRHSRHLDLRSQFSNDEEFAVSGFRLLRRLIRFIISFFLFLLSSSSFYLPNEKKGEGNQVFARCFSPRPQMQQDENHNHKPVFSNCSNYAPVVKEEEPVGTVVIQVHAKDRDNPDNGGFSLFIIYLFIIYQGI